MPTTICSLEISLFSQDLHSPRKSNTSSLGCVPLVVKLTKPAEKGMDTYSLVGINTHASLCMDFPPYTYYNTHFFVSKFKKMKKNDLAALLVISIILTSFLFQSTMADQPPASGPNSGFCEEKCKGRCSKAGRYKRCMTECNICCSKCNCVPSGTYGNKSECPCYANLLNSKGTSKCP